MKLFNFVRCLAKLPLFNEAAGCVIHGLVWFFNCGSLFFRCWMKVRSFSRCSLNVECMSYLSVGPN